MKVTTLAELKAAFDSGELKADNCSVVIDNCDVWASRAVGDDDAEYVYQSTPDQMLRDALTLLGIHWVNC
jgi:hypothetical protein